MALDENSETFVIYVASLNLAPAPGIHQDKAAQIAFLFTKEVMTSEEYSDFTDVFSEEKALILPEQTEFN